MRTCWKRRRLRPSRRRRNCSSNRRRRKGVNLPSGRAGERPNRTRIGPRVVGPNPPKIWPNPKRGRPAEIGRSKNRTTGRGGLLAIFLGLLRRRNEPIHPPKPLGPIDVRPAEGQQPLGQGGHQGLRRGKEKQNPTSTQQRTDGRGQPAKAEGGPPQIHQKQRTAKPQPVPYPLDTETDQVDGGPALDLGQPTKQRGRKGSGRRKRGTGHRARGKSNGTPPIRRRRRSVWEPKPAVLLKRAVGATGANRRRESGRKSAGRGTG